MNLKKDGLIGTTVFHTIVALLLIFFGFSYPDPPPEEEGILVNFGTDFTGFGEEEPEGDETQGGEQQAPAEEISEEPSTPVEEQVPTQSEPVREEVQDFEESPVKENKPTPEEIRQREIEAEKQRQEEIERERQRQAELERQRIERERKEKAERLQKMGESAFGNKGVGSGNESQGEAGGTGNQGSTSGMPGVDNYGEGGGLGKGISYGLGDRKGRGRWPLPIVDNCDDVTGRIIIKVQIDVDSEGNVVGNPVIDEATYLDDCITKAVLQAAKQAKFTTADNFRQRGWIRYIIDP
jgi:outer membrane biosynthesis protein TonB